MLLKDIDEKFLSEDEQYECKARLDRTNTLGWLKTVDGFANTKGGVFYIGVEDKTFKLIGLDASALDSEKLFVYQTIKEHMNILPNIATSTIAYSIHGKERYLLKLEVSESVTKPLFIKYNGMITAFVRKDGFTSPATEEELREMMRQSVSPQYDSQITSILYKEEDFETFFAFYASLNKGKKPTEKELSSIGFFDSENHLSMAAYLFSDSYKGDRTEIVCTAYQGFTKGDDYILSSNSYRGSLIGGFNFANAFLSPRINHGFIKKDQGRINIDAYPSRALFEALINAIAHRDYLMEGTQIDVDLFPNRLVITTPGNLFGKGDLSITYDLLSFASRRRNRLISAILVYANAMEAKGTGLEKIAKEYEPYPEIYRPYIFSRNNQFTLVLPDLTSTGIRVPADGIKVLGTIQNPSKLDSEILSLCYSEFKKASDIAMVLHLSASSYLRDILKNLAKQGYLTVSKEGNSASYKANQEKVKLK